MRLSEFELKRLAARIAMLGRRPPRRKAIAGIAALSITVLATGYAAWAQQPDPLVTRTAAQTRDPRLGHWVEQPGPGSFGMHITYGDLGDGRFRLTLGAHAPPMNQEIVGQVRWRHVSLS